MCIKLANEKLDNVLSLHSNFSCVTGTTNHEKWKEGHQFREQLRNMTLD